MFSFDRRHYSPVGVLLLHQSIINLKKIQLTLPRNRQVQTLFVAACHFKDDRATLKTVATI